MSVVKKSIQDPAAWVAFVGFMLGGIQSMIGATGDTLFSAQTMGLLTLGLGVVGLLVRGVEMYFIKRIAAANEAEDQANIAEFKNK